MEIYFDNAATTALDPEVFDAMVPYLTQYFGNPSSTHRAGQEARRVVDKARKTVADLLNASPSEITFTSGATESDNLAIAGSLRGLGIRHAISSPIEHKAVLQPLTRFSPEEGVRLHWLPLDTRGRPDYDYLERLLHQHRTDDLPSTLVSLMHGNNEIGNLNDLAHIAWLCKEYNALFHSDTVQTIGRYPFDLADLPIDFIVGSAHKFHGPKGVGFLYARKRIQLPALLYGGNQEQGLRPGTENVTGIVGLAKALEISYRDRLSNQIHVRSLKERLINRLTEVLPQVRFNGLSALPAESIDTVLSLSLPPLPSGDSLVTTLDHAGIAVSGGSACSNLIRGGSHVLSAIGSLPGWEHVRLSLGKYNTQTEVDILVAALESIYEHQSADLIA
ncbi:aminotransferase class V-fold PLP-dependent enzyme [Spirosoma sp. HMF4905]|uniref:cysteine desulfurase n=1 Tax=Spirosoma arboris TaxID=2682092 RepID=A0A7K1S6V3_9BACT|nr:cysteine desulfurase family protein [Spirosoma arboris]MVM29318.1 aminotransferase class V-fold PLP-dependent enzyme [Spirosoma arboris]